MLVSREEGIEILLKDPFIGFLAEERGGVDQAVAYACDGCFQVPTFSVHIDRLKDVYLFEDGRVPYGVCDTPEQVLNYFPELATADTRYLVTFVYVGKTGEPERHGWRWEKWGPYIGVRESRADYLNDEPVIDYVLCYSVHEVKA